MIVTIEKIYVWSDEAGDFIFPPELDDISGDFEIREYATASRAYCATEELRRASLDTSIGYEVCYFKDYIHYRECCAQWDILPEDYWEVIFCD